MTYKAPRFGIVYSRKDEKEWDEHLRDCAGLQLFETLPANTSWRVWENPHNDGFLYSFRAQCHLCHETVQLPKAYYCKKTAGPGRGNFSSTANRDKGVIV